MCQQHVRTIDPLITTTRETAEQPGTYREISARCSKWFKALFYERTISCQ